MKKSEKFSHGVSLLGLAKALEVWKPVDIVLEARAGNVLGKMTLLLLYFEEAVPYDGR